MLHVPVAVEVAPGRLDARNGRHVVALLDRALKVRAQLQPHLADRLGRDLDVVGLADPQPRAPGRDDARGR